MEKIRIGLIGCGGMMRSHAEGLKVVEGVEITAVCDIVRERAENVAEVLNNPYVTTDYMTMADYIDAVLIALPHHLHYHCGLFFARQKKHVLMEKPLCNTEEECIRLINECEQAGVTLMCAYPVRYWPGVIKLKELMDSGEYGKPFMMSVWTEQLTHYDDFHWGNSSCLGGGQLFSHGCHYIDILLWFLGKPVSGTHFGTNLGTPWMIKEGTSAATIRFESGAIGYHGATWGARGTKLGYSFHIHMEKGMLEYDHKEGVIRLFEKDLIHEPGNVNAGNSYKVLWTRGATASKLTQHEMNHFLDCIRNGKTPITDGWTSLQGLRVIWKMYDAEKFGVVADLRDCALPEK